MKHTFFPQGFIHLNFFSEFSVYVLSQLVLAPGGYLYKNYRVGERWKQENEAKDTLIQSHISGRQKDWRQMENEVDGWKLVLDGGWLSWDGPGLYEPSLRMPRQDPVFSRTGPSLVFCLPLCSQAALPHFCSMMGEDGRATYQRLDGYTVASKARRGRKEGSNVRGQSDLCCSRRVDSVYPPPSTAVPLTSSLGCRRVDSMIYSLLNLFLINGE